MEHVGRRAVRGAVLEEDLDAGVALLVEGLHGLGHSEIDAVALHLRRRRVGAHVPFHLQRLPAALAKVALVHLALPDLRQRERQFRLAVGPVNRLRHGRRRLTQKYALSRRAADFT